MAMTGFRRAVSFLAPATLLTLSAPSQAQEDDAPTRSSDIIVTGKAIKDKQAVEKQARAITQGGIYYRSPLAQFQDPVCPGIIGLPVETASLIVDRIRYNAERIGIRTAQDGKCIPNIIVAFIHNGQADLKALSKKSGHLFRGIAGPELNELLANPGPVHAWWETAIRSRQGDLLQGESENLTQIPTLNVAQSQSHIFLAHRIDITRSIVLMDLSAVDGLSVVQLADYATMRTFARTRAISGEGAADTILGLFDPDGARPPKMTSFDLAYLKSIYGGIPNLVAASKLAAIHRELRKQHTQDQDGAASKP
jgi:hypothetical protein